MFRYPLRLSLLLLLAFSPFSMAGEHAAVTGSARLAHFLDGLQRLRANFIQSLVDDSGRILEESHGVLLLSRPGRFRLHYQQPYEQIYVADGTRLWLYDRDLQQVTVRYQESALGSTPALLLTSSEPLEQRFTLRELGAHEGFQWLELRPRDADANVDYIRLALEASTLRAMEMSDGLGQTTRLYLTEIERNPSLPTDTFQFHPPLGVDVVGDLPTSPAAQ